MTEKEFKEIILGVGSSSSSAAARLALNLAKSQVAKFDEEAVRLSIDTSGTVHLSPEGDIDRQWHVCEPISPSGKSGHPGREWCISIMSKMVEAYNKSIGK